MKYVLKIVLLVMMLPVMIHAQQNAIDSLHIELHLAKDDSVKWNLNEQIYSYYYESNRDSSLKYINKSLLIAQKNNKKINMASNLIDKGYQLTHLGHFAEAFECFRESFFILEDSGNESKSWMMSNMSSKTVRLHMLAKANHMYAILMGATGNSKAEIDYFNQAKDISAQVKDTIGITRIMLANMNLGAIYFDLQKLDSALWFVIQAENTALQMDQKKYLSNIYDVLGEIAVAKGDTLSAKKYFYQGMQLGVEQNNFTSLLKVYFDITELQLAQKNKDSSLYYASKSLQLYELIFNNTNQKTETGLNLGEIYSHIAESYRLNNLIDSAYKYKGLAIIAKDSIYNRRINNLAAFQTASLNENIRLQQLEKDRVARENKIRTIILLTGIVLFLLIALLLYRNNRKEKKAKNLLKQKNEVIEQTIDHLKSTQSQLIQSEKMASLGELTAGIAHEIQNPLNFVNNFSELSNELIDELKEELESGNLQPLTEIADDVKENLNKINHHGKRAESIVKGMLLHSRSSSGQKEPTDINALCDEYLRLSYHGFRAKDKSFNADFKLEADESLPIIEVVQQDIGRVLLNLINNAFYAAPLPPEGGFKDPNYIHKPIVTVKTSLLPPSRGQRGAVVVSVADNGPGIPDSIKDKIFQPFFTTKPTGLGTGLGLSLSYDIVKAHGGELKVETNRGIGSEFIIQLPIKSS